MISGVLGRYFAKGLFFTVISVFAGVFNLIFTVNFVETLRRSGDHPNVNPAIIAWLAFLQTPIVAEQALPFVVLIGAMVAFLNFSRRLELVVARAAGVSVWQFLAPAASRGAPYRRRGSHRLQPAFDGHEAPRRRTRRQVLGSGLVNAGSFWLRQKTIDGQSIINIATRVAGRRLPQRAGLQFRPRRLVLAARRRSRRHAARRLLGPAKRRSSSPRAFDSQEAEHVSARELL